MLAKKNISSLQGCADNQINKELIKVISERNSFGYKVIDQQHLDIVSKWYKQVHGLDIHLTSETTQFFNNPGLFYAALILGITNTNDCVLVAATTSAQIQSKIVALNRKIHILNNYQGYQDQSNRQFKLIEEIKQKIQQAKIIIFYHPDLIHGRNFSLDFFANICRLCQQNNVVFICDESQADLCQSLPSTLPINSPKKIVIRSIGKHLRNRELQKSMCVYGSSELKQQCNKNYSKSLKLLPSDMIIALIEVSMGKLGKQIYKQSLDNIKHNQKQLVNLFLTYGEKEPKNQPYICPLLILNLNNIRSLLLKKELLMIYGKESLKNLQKTFIKIDLRLDPIYFKERIQKIINRISQPKL